LRIRRLPPEYAYIPQGAPPPQQQMDAFDVLDDFLDPPQPGSPTPVGGGVQR
jgi:hypothetical protein